MTKIIAEVASCHNGDIELAKAHAKVAKDIGIEIVKYQSWKAEYVKDSDPDKARYQKYEFTDSMHWEVKKYCDEIGIEFLSTVTRIERIPFLKELGLKKVKIASVSLSNIELLKAAVENFEEVIASTGMQEWDTIFTAAHILRINDTLLHCTVNYPCRLADANLNKLNFMKNHLLNRIGYSDHTQGIEAPIIAMSMGINYLEKHLTLSRHLPQIPHQMYEGGPYVTTHKVANEPDVFREIVRWRDIIQKAKEAKEVNEVEKKIKERYLNRY